MHISVQAVAFMHGCLDVHRDYGHYMKLVRGGGVAAAGNISISHIAASLRVMASVHPGMTALQPDWCLLLCLLHLSSENQHS